MQGGRGGGLPKVPWLVELPGVRGRARRELLGPGPDIFPGDKYGCIGKRRGGTVLGHTQELPTSCVCFFTLQIYVALFPTPEPEPGALHKVPTIATTTY